ncbi:MAG: hypothetical protein QNI92_04710 [Desulfobacterales bacterium]|nr:hypothetical protein [Desulfobacterales bacterium]MDJ0912887.1 hypothetical protein [Desulfobacterales bacterium]
MIKHLINITLIILAIKVMTSIEYWWQDWEFWAIVGLVIGAIINNSRMIWR